MQFILNGVWGLAPRQVAGTPVPAFSPFPGERGQGDRDFKIVTCLINELFGNLTHSFLTEKN